MTSPLGNKIDPSEHPLRDAVHVAIIPVIAGESLYAGAYFKLAYGSTTSALMCGYGQQDAIGVIDPFLGNMVHIKKGDKCWGMLFPDSVTGMRHHWKHTTIDNVEKPKDEHELWIRRFCDEWNFDYNELIANATSTDDWRYVVARGKDLHSARELGGDEDLFWEHLEALTDRKFDREHREEMGWSCSC